MGFAHTNACCLSFYSMLITTDRTALACTLLVSGIALAIMKEVSLLILFFTAAFILECRDIIRSGLPDKMRHHTAAHCQPQPGSTAHSAPPIRSYNNCFQLTTASASTQQ